MTRRPPLPPLVGVLALVAALLVAPVLGRPRPAAANPVPAGGLAGDFDGDGEADLAIGVPGWRAGSEADAGAVEVLYGSAAGLSTDGNRLWGQGSPGVPGDPGTGDRMGAAVAVGDFDGDSISDLAVGIPGDAVGGRAAGSVLVLYGSLSGLTTARAHLWSQDDPTIVGVAEAGDAFGSALAAGDFDGDGFADLAVGVPGENPGTAPGAGVVNVLYGSPSGLNGDRDALWSQDRTGVAGTAASGDRFGSALAAGNFGHGPQDDLAVGAPFDDEGGATDAGVAGVLYGSSSGLGADGDQLWAQGASGLGEKAEAGDQFGFSLAAADMGRGAEDDLAVGSPGEDFTGASDAGAVQAIYGGTGGLAAAGSQVWSEGTGGLRGTRSGGDRFGWSLAAAELGNATRATVADLAVGAPFDDEAGPADSGAVVVVYGTAGGLSAQGNQLWTQGSAGVAGTPAAGEHLGMAVGAGEFGNGPRWDLGIGVPDEDLGTPGTADAGSVTVLYGFVHGGLSTTSTQRFTQNTAGVAGTAQGGAGFGSSLS